VMKHAGQQQILPSVRLAKEAGYLARAVEIENE
jgi:hypothetical protein